LDPEFPQRDLRSPDGAREGEAKPHTPFLQGVHDGAHVVLLALRETVPPCFELVRVDDFDHLTSIGIG